MSLDYALVTSSSLPSQVKGSEYYTEVDKSQWLDLVDYCQDLVSQDSSQNITFLIVAKGTEEQEAADKAKKDATDELASKNAEDADRENQAAKASALKESAAAATRKELRDKSKSIFNALYRR
tara:strand:- start:578 stop:946 length:369 start_codon:yes stop_codon:yes gene_type:complete